MVQKSVLLIKFKNLGGLRFFTDRLHALKTTLRLGEFYR